MKEVLLAKIEDGKWYFQYVSQRYVDFNALPYGWFQV